MNNIEFIKNFCEKYNIRDYTINDDLSIDVYDDVDLDFDPFGGYNKLNYIPIKFNKVIGYFSCSDNNLKTLKNCPTYVGRSFYCDNNMLSSLEYSPDYVRHDFICNYNRFTSLEYLSKYIGNELQCYHNPLESFDGLTTSYNKLFCDDKTKLVRKYKLNNILQKL